MEIEAMHDLYKQGQINKVELHMISANEARKIDGLVRGYGNEFIWSPTTCVADAKGLCKLLASDLEQTGKVEIKRGEEYLKTLTHKDTFRIQLKSGEIIETKYLINSAG
jgi:L-2-hydroxyglutarate oxidase LhgO